jgi:hypothetical protein
MFNSELFSKQSLTTFMSFLIVGLIFIIIISGYANKSSLNENFAFMPWNMGTRFYPSYDLRGYPPTYNQLLINSKKSSYPLLFPWNYPYPGMPYLFWSPYFYEANGKYTVDKDYAKSLVKVLTKPLRT